MNNKNYFDMLVTISLLILVYMILDKDVSLFVEYVKNIDRHSKINAKVEDMLNERFGVEYEMLKG